MNLRGTDISNIPFTNHNKVSTNTSGGYTRNTIIVVKLNSFSSFSKCTILNKTVFISYISNNMGVLKCGSSSLFICNTVRIVGIFSVSNNLFFKLIKFFSRRCSNLRCCSTMWIVGICSMGGKIYFYTSNFILRSSPNLIRSYSMRIIDSCSMFYYSLIECIKCNLCRSSSLSCSYVMRIFSIFSMSKKHIFS